MSLAPTATSAWNERAYARISSVAHRGGEITVRFEDGAEVTVEAERLVPSGAARPDWDALRFTPYEVIAPSADGDVEIPWDVIRALTDPAFAAHLAAAGAEDARRIGLRLTELRHGRGLTGADLAARAGLAPEHLQRLEAGQAGIPLQDLERLLTAMGYTLHELAVAAEE